VVRGSMHYRALFMVGLVLFTITLAINWLAQRFVARFRMSVG
jgi:phosphate transport system permease protein